MCSLWRAICALVGCEPKAIISQDGPSCGWVAMGLSVCNLPAPSTKQDNPPSFVRHLHFLWRSFYLAISQHCSMLNLCLYLTLLARSAHVFASLMYSLTSRRQQPRCSPGQVQPSGAVTARGGQDGVDLSAEAGGSLAQFFLRNVEWVHPEEEGQAVAAAHP